MVPVTRLGTVDVAEVDSPLRTTVL